MATDARGWVNVLRESHDRLAGIVAGLSPEQIAGPSYCDDWSVAQVLSHLGSGAEIGLMNLEAMLAHEDAPARERYQEIWATWDAKTPANMAKDFLVSDEAHISRLEGLSDAELNGLSTQFMGRTMDAVGIVGMRLGEHSVHTWDVETVVDPAATVAPDAAALVVDIMPARVGRMASGPKPAGLPTEVTLHTTEPEHSYQLSIGTDEVAMAAGEGAESSVTLTAEAFIRLLWGRLDPDHTPAGISATGPVSLDDLRALFNN